MDEKIQALVEEHGFERPCRALLRHLVKADPAMLLNLCRDRLLKDHLLTFAAEYLGGVEGSTEVVVGLLNHPSALVREGALLGLPEDTPEVREVVALKVLTETSPAVKELMSEYLEWNDV